MHRSLAVMIAERLRSSHLVTQMGATVWYSRAPVGVSRPYVIFADESSDSEETATQQMLQTQEVSLSCMGDQLASQVEPLLSEMTRLLQDYLPDLPGCRVLRAQVMSAPQYGVDDDGSGDVQVGRVPIRYRLQVSKE